MEIELNDIKNNTNNKMTKCSNFKYIRKSVKFYKNMYKIYI